MDSFFGTHRYRLHASRFATACLGLLFSLLFLSPCATGAQIRSGSVKPAQFGPGVRIDWQARVVELDAEVVLRKGSLELLACSPQSREHESILRVHARPLHVYQAMGLIGLTPGSPMKFDEKSKQWRRPTGDSLSLSVRYVEKGNTSVVPIERWMRSADRKPLVTPFDWVFSGSRTLKGGKFGADLDGTVVCVVDFDTSLITVRDLHSADNEDLWLEANTEAIPPVGTICTLLIRGVPAVVPVVRLLADGSMRHQSKPLSLVDLAKLAHEEWAKRDGVAVILEVASGVSQVARQDVLRALDKVGVGRKRIEIRPLTTDRPRP